MARAQKEDHPTIRLNKLPEVLSNFLICKRIPYNRTTESGLYLGVLIQDQYLFDKVDREFEVVKTPRRLLHATSHFSANWGMPWIVDMDMLPGDRIWVVPSETVGCVKIIVGDDEYYMIHYESIRAAKRGEDVITVNGFNVCEKIKYKEKALDYHIDRIDDLKLKIAYPAKPNKSYVRTDGHGGYIYHDLDISIQFHEGDVVLKKDKEQWEFKLEGMFKSFSEKDYFCIQSRFLSGVESDR